jgi:hypothetical protein
MQYVQVSPTKLVHVGPRRNRAEIMAAVAPLRLEGFLTADMKLSAVFDMMARTLILHHQRHFGL